MSQFFFVTRHPPTEEMIEAAQKMGYKPVLPNINVFFGENPSSQLDELGIKSGDAALVVMRPNTPQWVAIKEWGNKNKVQLFRAETVPDYNKRQRIPLNEIKGPGYADPTMNDLIQEGILIAIETFRGIIPRSFEVIDGVEYVVGSPPFVFKEFVEW